MSGENFGVIIFLVLIVAFVVYIIAAAMRDKKKKTAGEDEDAFEDLNAALPETDSAAGPPRCYACMTKLDGEAVCPVCGMPQPVREKPGHLPVGVLLADRYIVGLDLSENCSCVNYLAYDRYLEIKRCVREYYPKDFAARADNGALFVEPAAQESFDAGKKRFVRDIMTLCGMNDISSAAGVGDLFYTNGTVYAVTEYAPGQPLAAYLEANGRFSPEYTLALFAPVIRQLEREQTMGLLRCQLSADSFMFGNGLLKLEGLGAPGGNIAAFPKPGFAPEELYRKSGVPGAWTDVYSLCAVMYACVTGVTPDEATDRVYKDNLRAPSSLGVYLSAAFEEALMKGLSVYREDRFQDCAALFRALYLGKSVAAAQEASFIRPIVDPLPESGAPFEEGRLFREPEDHDVIS
ncbi:MAG: hypothetical protein IJK89_07205 [Clostridia bacterium]|nr:hypothetical protein [Clostridia bacterium]